jgi:VIT1/CCC1 family predicted Fe2+/Mn2+ transporter
VKSVFEVGNSHSWIDDAGGSNGGLVGTQLAVAVAAAVPAVPAVPAVAVAAVVAVAAALAAAAAAAAGVVAAVVVTIPPRPRIKYRHCH